MLDRFPIQKLCETATPDTASALSRSLALSRALSRSSTALARSPASDPDSEHRGTLEPLIPTCVIPLKYAAGGGGGRREERGGDAQEERAINERPWLRSGCHENDEPKAMSVYPRAMDVRDGCRRAAAACPKLFPISSLPPPPPPPPPPC